MATPTPFVSPLAVTRKQAVDRTVADLKLLPSNAAVAMKVLELKRSATSSAADFARVIAADPALATKVLALANSAAFSPSQPVTRLTIANAMIGLNNLLPLVFGLSFAGIFNKLSLPPADQAALWRASLLKAVTARECIRHLDNDIRSEEEREAVSEEVFLMALVQDIALPVFYAADRSAWPEFLAVLEASDGDRAGRENKTYGVDHATLAAACIRAMELPDGLARTAAVHHGGLAALGPLLSRPMAIAVDAAASLPHRIPALSPKLLQSLAVRLRGTSNASVEELTAVTKGVAEEFGRLTTLFAEPEDATASYKQFLQKLGSEVAECLQASIMKSASEISGLKDRERHLRESVVALEGQAQRAEFDPLTKTLTRAAFLARLNKLLELARQHGAPCAIGFLDLDDFKQINDGHGHAAGDAALIEAARVLGEAVHDIGILGRIGGDEFVFALIAREGTLEKVASAFSAKAQKFTAEYAGGRLELSASIGIVPLGVPGPSVNGEAALRDADQLMYQAKRAGKGKTTFGATTAANPKSAA